jgi:hypothetical protein
MFTDTTWAAPVQGLRWPAAYRGVGIVILPLPDGRFVGITEGGYRSDPYPDAQAALADVTAWIDRQGQGVRG